MKGGRSAENIAQAAYCANDLGLAGVAFDLFAQARDSQVNRPDIRIPAAIMRALQQLVAIEDLARIGRENLKQAEFHGCDRHFLPTVIKQSRFAKV